ncbi:MAG: hypothetical protein IJB85_02145 [Clostridia bacterium]|nr:hypothetical protein [Clostridia bacterium]
MSKIRKIYFARLFGRIFILVLSCILFFTKSSIFAPLEGMRFFDGISLLHVLWLIWMIDMLSQLLPIQKDLSIGSLKVFRQHFRPIREKVSIQALKEHIRTATKAAFWVMLLWCLLIAAIGALHAAGILSHVHLFLITVVFYVCDLICVLIWCPFRLMMRNRCCTTCRIFNWDHLMMFSPLLFVPSFYAWSLFGMSLLVFLIWEGCILMHPERFWDKTNAALQCANCTDKLCTQYCQKLRK